MNGMEPVTPARYSELVPLVLREPPPRRAVRRKRDVEEEGVGFDPPPLFYGEGIPFMALFALVLGSGLLLRLLPRAAELSGILVFAGAFFLVPTLLLFGLLWLGETQSGRDEKRLVRAGVAVIGTATRAETLPIPDDFGSERTVHYTFSPVEGVAVIEGVAKTVSGRLESVYAGSPVAVIYDPKNVEKRHELIKMMNYGA